MALLFIDGFEARDGAMKWSIFDTGNGGGFVAGRFGGTALNTNGGQFGAGTPGSRVRFTAAATAIVGCALNNNQTGPLITFSGDNTATQHISIVISGTNNVQIYRGAYNGTLLATSAGIVPLNQWDYWEFKVTVHSTTGYVEVRRNGGVVVTYSGNTKNGGTNNSCDAFSFLSVANFTPNLRVDDVYVADTTGSVANDFLGDVKVLTLVPTGAGAQTNLTPSTGANWSCVDELPWSATDYVSGSSVGARDSYAMTDPDASVFSVFGLQVTAIAKKTDAGVRNLKTMVRRGSTFYPDSTAVALSSSDVAICSMRTTDPGSGGAWTPANVASTEIGVEIA